METCFPFSKTATFDENSLGNNPENCLLETDKTAMCFPLKFLINWTNEQVEVFVLWRTISG